MAESKAKAAEKNTENQRDVLKKEWGKIHKPENVVADTAFVLAASIVGSAITGLIGLGMGMLVNLISAV